MSRSQDTPLTARVARWLDRWFALRWRALLTWVVLVMLTEDIWYGRIESYRMSALIHWVLDLFSRNSHIPLSPLVYSMAPALNLELFTSWFEPLALRLNLWRSAGWIGAQLGAALVHTIISGAMQREWALPACWFFRAAMCTWVLWGWRSRPWMCAVGVGLSFGVVELRVMNPHNSNAAWLNGAVVLPMAAVLLYGTRLLRPKERERPS